MQRIIMLGLIAIAFLGAATSSFSQPRIFPIKDLKFDGIKQENDSDPLSDFPEKGLPEAEVIGANPSYSSGAEAARRILKFDDDALPVLIAALQKGGFHILNERDKPLYLPRSGPGLDIGFYDFEVAGMLRGVGFGYGSSIEKLARALAGDGSQMSSTEVARRLLKDLRAMRNSNDPHIQFNAGLIFEMAKLTPENGDLENGPANSIKLNMIQAALIERLLLLDLLTLFENFGGTSGQMFHDPLFYRRNAASIVKAAFSGSSMGLCDGITDISSYKKTIKTGEKVVKTVKTYSELSKDINKLDDLKNSQTVKGVSVVNAALAWAKVVMAFLNVVATTDIEQPMPLIRTKESGNRTGEKRNAKVKVVMNFNHSELINCVGTTLGTLTDVKFSVPTSGPLSGVTVSWEVLLTSTRASNGFWGSFFDGPDYQKFTSVPTFVDAANGGDISRQKTDEKGENTVVLTGKPQPYDMTRMAVVPLPKKVNLRAKFALEKMDAKKDIPKIVKLGIGTSIDPLSVLELVADMVMKMPLKSTELSVPVRDWQPCTADWGGSIRVTKELKQDIVVKGTRTGNGNSTGDGFRQISNFDEAIVELNPRTSAEIEAKAVRKPATVYVRGRHSDIFNGKRESDPCCGPISGKYTTSFRSGTEFTYSKVVSNPFDIRVNASERDFRISLGLGTPMFPTLQRTFLEIEKTDCPLDRESAFDRMEEGTYALAGYLEEGRYGNRYADETGEIMVGNATNNDLTGAKVTWSWELARCGK